MASSTIVINSESSDEGSGELYDEMTIAQLEEKRKEITGQRSLTTGAVSFSFAKRPEGKKRDQK